MIKSCYQKLKIKIKQFKAEIQKYGCHNGNSCTYTSSRDDWHCDGCKHKGLYQNSQQIQTIPNLGYSVDINSNGDELLTTSPDKEVKLYIKKDDKWNEKNS